MSVSSASHFVPVLPSDLGCPACAVLLLHARTSSARCGAGRRAARAPERAAPEVPPHRGRPRGAHRRSRPTAALRAGGSAVDVRVLHRGPASFGSGGLPADRGGACGPPAPAAARDARRRPAPPERDREARHRISRRRTATRSCAVPRTGTSARSRSSSPRSVPVRMRLASCGGFPNASSAGPSRLRRPRPLRSRHEVVGEGGNLLDAVVELRPDGVVTPVAPPSG